MLGRRGAPAIRTWAFAASIWSIASTTEKLCALASAISLSSSGEPNLRHHPGFGQAGGEDAGERKLAGAGVRGGANRGPTTQPERRMTAASARGRSNFTLPPEAVICVSSDGPYMPIVTVRLLPSAAFDWLARNAGVHISSWGQGCQTKDFGGGVVGS